MRKAPASFLLVALVAGLAGCSGKSKSRELVFVPDPPGSDPAVFLRARGLLEDRLVVEVVGRSIASVYGVAFRLRYDPEVLALRSMVAGEPWSTSALSVASEPGPGLTVAAVTEKGPSGGFDANDSVLAVLEFELRSQTETPVEFVVESSAVVVSDGTRLSAVSWAGGRLELQ